MTSPMIKLMVLSLLVISTGADYELMKKECNHTAYKNTCLKCLESDLNSYQANRNGFAKIIINCLESHLYILNNNVTSVLAKKGESEAIKKVLEDCKMGFPNAKFLLGHANHSVVIHNYDNAIILLKNALTYPQTCRHNLKKLKFKESPEIYEEINVYAHLSSAAKTMIQRLEYTI